MKKYIKPSTSVIEMETEPLLLSMSASDSIIEGPVGAKPDQGILWPKTKDFSPLSDINEDEM